MEIETATVEKLIKTEVEVYFLQLDEREMTMLSALMGNMTTPKAQNEIRQYSKKGEFSDDEVGQFVYKLYKRGNSDGLVGFL